MGNVSDNITFQPAEKLKCLGADRADIDLHLWLRHCCMATMAVLNRLVFSPAQATVGRNHDEPNALDLTLHQSRTAILGIRMGQVRDDVANLGRIRSSGSHALLRLAHLLAATISMALVIF